MLPTFYIVKVNTEAMRIFRARNVPTSEYTPWPGLSHVEDFRANGSSALASDVLGRQSIDR